MSITTTINAQVKAIVDDVRALPETIKKIDIADLQKQAEGLVQTAVGTATATYTDLTKRGEDVVSKAKGIKVEDIRKTVDHAADDAQKRAEQLVTDAKNQVTKVTSKAPTAAREAAEKVDTTVKRAQEEQCRDVEHLKE